MKTKTTHSIPLFKVSMPETATAEVIKILESGYIGQGPKVDEFEEGLKGLFSTPYPVTVNSCTSALQLALRLAGVEHGDEVISTPLTCTATNMPILAAGARPVWADVKDDFNISPVSVRERMTDKVKAIMVMHWGGYSCDMDELIEISKEFDVPIIEDCAHAILSTYKDRQVGTFSDYGCFSFQAIKHMTTVDGGCLITASMEDYRRAKLLRWYGINREDNSKTDFRCELDIAEWGYKFHMNDIAAAIGIAQLDRVRTTAELCYLNKSYYDSKLDSIPGINLTQTRQDRKSSAWLYTFMAEDRDNLMRHLKDKGIASSRVHERNDGHTCFKESVVELPHLEEVVAGMISIPVGWWVDGEAREYIVNCIKEGW
jgi:dTDP-4-amino-4,6-dideoxygalactose transaminase